MTPLSFLMLLGAIVAVNLMSMVAADIVDCNACGYDCKSKCKKCVLRACTTDPFCYSSCVAKVNACKAASVMLDVDFATVQSSCTPYILKPTQSAELAFARQTIIDQGYFNGLLTADQINAVQVSVCFIPSLKFLGHRYGAGAMTFNGNTIYIDPSSYQGDTASFTAGLAHELYHVYQYHLYGNGGFKCRYGSELVLGHHTDAGNAVENPAYAMENRVTSDLRAKGICFSNSDCSTNYCSRNRCTRPPTKSPTLGAVLPARPLCGQTLVSSQNPTAHVYPLFLGSLFGDNTMRYLYGENLRVQPNPVPVYSCTDSAGLTQLVAQNGASKVGLSFDTSSGNPIFYTPGKPNVRFNNVVFNTDVLINGGYAGRMCCPNNYCALYNGNLPEFVTNSVARFACLSPSERQACPGNVPANTQYQTVSKPVCGQALLSTAGAPQLFVLNLVDKLDGTFRFQIGSASDPSKYYQRTANGVAMPVIVCSDGAGNIQLIYYPSITSAPVGISVDPATGNPLPWVPGRLDFRIVNNLDTYYAQVRIGQVTYPYAQWRFSCRGGTCSVTTGAVPAFDFIVDQVGVYSCLSSSLRMSCPA